MANRWETVTDFIFSGSRITADGDCSHEIKRHLLLEREVMTNLDSTLKSRDFTLLTKVCLCFVCSQSFGFFQWSCMDVRVGPWRSLNTKELMLLNCGAGEDLQVSWTARGSNQSIPKEIISECSLEGLMLKLKLQHFGNLLWKDPDAGEDCRQEEKGMREDEMVGWHHWLTRHEFEQTPGDSEE